MVKKNKGAQRRAFKNSQKRVRERARQAAMPQETPEEMKVQLSQLDLQLLQGQAKLASQIVGECKRLLGHRRKYGCLPWKHELRKSLKDSAAQMEDRLWDLQADCIIAGEDLLEAMDRQAAAVPEEPPNRGGIQIVAPGSPEATEALRGGQ